MAKRIDLIKFAYRGGKNGYRVAFNVEGLFIVILLGLAALVCMSEPTVEIDPQLANYCEMVRIHRISPDPALGWPDFKGIYDAECR